MHKLALKISPPFNRVCVRDECLSILYHFNVIAHLLDTKRDIKISENWNNNDIDVHIEVYSCNVADTDR